MRFAVIALVIAPWITAAFGILIPELFIAAGLLAITRALMIANNWLGAGDDYVDVVETRIAKARARGYEGRGPYAPEKAAWVFGLAGAVLVGLGSAGSFGLLA